MDKNMGETKSLNVVRIPASLFFQFKMDALKKKETIREAIIFLMEAYVKTDNPGDDVEKKTDNPGLDLKSPEEILADKILEGRKAWEDLKKLEKEPVIEEPVDESLKVYSVEKLDGIRKTKEPVIEEPVIEEPVIEEPVIEEPAAEINPGSENPEEERERRAVDRGEEERREEDRGEEGKTFFRKIDEFFGRLLPPWY